MPINLFFTRSKHSSIVVAAGIIIAACAANEQVGPLLNAPQGAQQQLTTTEPVSTSCKEAVRALATATAETSRLPTLVLEEIRRVQDVSTDYLNNRVTQATLDRFREGQGDISAVTQNFSDVLLAASCFDEIERLDEASCDAVRFNSLMMQVAVLSVTQASVAFMEFYLEFFRVYDTPQILDFDADGYLASAKDYIDQAEGLPSVVVVAQRDIEGCITAIN